VKHCATKRDLRRSHIERPSFPPVPGKLDKGIRRAVEILMACGIETFESCEGGPGHSYTEPTVSFYGTPEAGWRALSVCLAHGLPIAQLRRAWNVLDANEPTGPHWEITFREKIC
jgi:sugar phosphate isomerase/epimerase